MNTRALRAVPIYIFSASSFFRAKWHKFCFLCAPLKSRRREKCFDFGTNLHREMSLVRTVQTFPLATLQRVFLARVPFIVLYILSLPSPFCQFSPPLIFRPFSAPSLVLPSLPSLSLPSLLLIRPIRPIRLIRVQKKFLSASCANSPSKLSPALYKPHGKASAIPLKSRKTQIFSNFLSQSLARFRKSPYFCTR